jgi:hypothetical protein
MQLLLTIGPAFPRAAPGGKHRNSDKDGQKNQGGMPDGLAHVFPSHKKSLSLQERFEKDYTKDDKIRSSSGVSGKSVSPHLPGVRKRKIIALQEPGLK